MEAFQNTNFPQHTPSLAALLSLTISINLIHQQILLIFFPKCISDLPTVPYLLVKMTETITVSVLYKSLQPYDLYIQVPTEHPYIFYNMFKTELICIPA